MADQNTGGSAHIRLITGDDLGLLKVVQAPSGTELSSAKVVATWGSPDKEESGVTALHISSSSSPGSLLAVARRSGKIDVLGTDAGALQGSAPAVPWEPSTACQSREVTGLSFLPQDGAASRRLLSCTRGGCMRIHGPPGTESPEGPTVASWSQLSSWAVPKEICAMAVSSSCGEAAVGTQGTSHLSVWDLATQQRLFQAKGAKPNAIGLVDKPWDSALAFLVGDQGRRVAVGTGYHKVRVYDVKAQRRPVMEVSFGEARVSALAPDLDGNRVWAGNAVGDVRALDLRMGKLQEGLKGSQGCVRALTTHPSLPLLASAGLDRFLRVYHTGTRALAAKVYLKQTLTAVQFCTASGLPGPEEGGAPLGLREPEEGAGERGSGEEEEEDEDEKGEDKYGDVEVLMTGGVESDAEEGAEDVRRVGASEEVGVSGGRGREGEIRREKKVVSRDRQRKSDRKEGRGGPAKRTAVEEELTGRDGREGGKERKSKEMHGRSKEAKAKGKRQKRTN